MLIIYQMEVVNVTLGFISMVRNVLAKLESVTTKELSTKLPKNVIVTPLITEMLAQNTVTLLIVLGLIIKQIVVQIGTILVPEILQTKI
jgi:hypothetical protein